MTGSELDSEQKGGNNEKGDPRLFVIRITGSHDVGYAWVTALPLIWLMVITSTAAWQKLTSDNANLGFLSAAHALSNKLSAGTLPPAKAAVAPQLIFNLQLDAVLTLFFISLLWLIVLDMLRICYRHLSENPVSMLTETPYLRSRLEEAG